MSFHRENITWPAVDGTWNIGFYSFYDTKSWNDEDYDSEWDVDYNWDSFWWASSGHRSAEAAMDHYRREHGNPGGSTSYTSRDGQYREELERLDEMLWAFQNPREHAAKKEAEQKKIIAQHNRTKRKQGKEFIETVGSGAYVRVDFITDSLSMQRYEHVTLVKDGDWVGFRKDGKFVRVYNKATATLHPKILMVASAQRASYGYGRW